MQKDPPPPIILLIIVGLMGVIAQLGVSLALGMVKDRAKLAGFLLLSLIFSSMTTLLLAQLTPWDDYVCAGIGTLVGAAPALWTLRAGIQLIGKRYGVSLGEIVSSTPAAEPPAPEGGKKP